MRIFSEQECDEVLLRWAAKGDEEAFLILYRRNQTGLFRFALHMTGSSWAAEEIVQDVFMVLMREPKKYDAARGTLSAYLYGIARNRVMKQLEKRPREVSLDAVIADGTPRNNGGGNPASSSGWGRGAEARNLDTPAAHGGNAFRYNFNNLNNSLVNKVTPAHWAEQQERIERVRAAVLELPAEFREAVVLCELEELSYEEAAQLIGRPIGTIRSRLHRGRGLLLAKLEMLRDEPRRCAAR